MTLLFYRHHAETAKDRRSRQGGRVWFKRRDDSTPLRRLRFALRVRRHPCTLAGYLRLLWADFVIHPLFEGGEVCEDCGRGYPLWRALDDLWWGVMDGPGGLLCPGCFDRRADDRGIQVHLWAVPWRRAVDEEIYAKSEAAYRLLRGKP